MAVGHIVCLVPSVAFHKYVDESAGPSRRRLRCSSSRGIGHTGGFETRPYKSSRLADDKNSYASSSTYLWNATLEARPGSRWGSRPSRLLSPPQGFRTLGGLHHGFHDGGAKGTLFQGKKTRGRGSGRRRDGISQLRQMIF